MQKGLGMNRARSVARAGLAVAGLTCGSGAAAQPLGPTPYLCAGDSPFNGVSFAWFYRDNFESGHVSVPGVTASAGAVAGPAGNVDSVDCDDGVINGTATTAHSFFYIGGPTGIRFTFNAGVLGGLPTHAGLVWTDGANPITFEAFDENNVSLGTVVGNHADNNFNGGTAEDRFYGWVHAGGISSIFIRNGSDLNPLLHLTRIKRRIDNYEID